MCLVDVIQVSHLRALQPSGIWPRPVNRRCLRTKGPNRSAPYDNTPLPVRQLVAFRLCGSSWPRWRLPKEADDWAEAFRPRTRSGWRAYALSKFAITLLASRLDQIDGVTAVAVNPGNAVTNVSRNMPTRHRKLLAVFKKTLITVVSFLLRPFPAPNVN
ncbi:unnamed protein product [Heligmosomoides polygyrus]|uniref:Uncharacterized protein n=1 Tax=Heligmosomoides polygyrus TaxID=6339 RepID=A0A3P8BMQ1_HELPZ|nr:unnamed protein product [Heligmosomoides polygyrus]